jgi:hypothetical protein
MLKRGKQGSIYIFDSTPDRYFGEAQLSQKEKVMKNVSRSLLVMLLIGIDAGIILAASRTINASTSANGQPHPATAPVKAGQKFTCTNATQSVNAPGNPPASCYVGGPGTAQSFPKNGGGAFSGPGTATLTCNGQGYLTCSLGIDD